jgi:hypothetical protein
MESQALSWNKQYFTSRGWAWFVILLLCIWRKVLTLILFMFRLDVNYGGSSGYGRQYMLVSVLFLFAL